MVSTVARSGRPAPFPTTHQLTGVGTRRTDRETLATDDSRPWAIDTFGLVTLRRTWIALAATALGLTACSTATDDREAGVQIPGGAAAASADTGSTTSVDADVTSSASTVAADSTTPESTNTAADDDPSGDATTTVEPETSTTTTTMVSGLDVFDPSCVVEVESGDSLGLIVDRYDDETINIATVRAENSIEGDTIYPGQLLDICVDNGLEDITGTERTERNAAIVAEEVAVTVIAQQQKLNELLTPFGMRELQVDGISGPVTRRHLCAARVGLGLDVTLANMEAGSAEEETLMAATEIVAPFTSALNQERWILVDRTCQVMFVGEGATTLNFVYPTSTGSEGFETRDQDQSRVFRYDPALDNDGWHDSTDYPVPADNPLNGNMYRPLYFDNGQAIHGANNVPTTPQSKGCVRLSPRHQDTLINWLGLQNATSPMGGIPVTVNVQGAYPHAIAPDAVTVGNATVDT